MTPSPPDRVEAESGAGPPKLYRPSNGMEGMCFMADWCDRCERDSAFQRDPENNDGCEIAAMTMAVGVGDPAYPREWRYSAGHPVCTAFQALTPTPERPA